MSTQSQKLISKPDFVFYRSEIKDGTVNCDFEFPVPPGMDEATLLITGSAVIATRSTYKLFQRPGQDGMVPAFPVGYASGTVLDMQTTVQVLIRTYLASDLIRLHIDALIGGNPQEYQVNALITKRTPHR